jgi:hypothetical protein
LAFRHVTIDTLPEFSTTYVEIQTEALGLSARVNAALTSRDLERVAPIERDFKRLLELAVDKLGLSARAFVKVLRVARTIADLEGNVVCWSSAGSLGFKGSRKSTPFAAQVAAEHAGRQAQECGVSCQTA